MEGRKGRNSKVHQFFAVNGVKFFVDGIAHLWILQKIAFVYMPRVA